MGIIDEVKSIATTIQQIDNIELYKQILDLQGEILKLVDENGQIKRQLAEVQDQLRTKQTLRFEHNSYWIGDLLENSDGPFCSNCWDTRTQLVRLWVMPDPAYSKCPTCNYSLLIPRRENSFGKVKPQPAVSFSAPPRLKIPEF